MSRASGSPLPFTAYALILGCAIFAPIAMIVVSATTAGTLVVFPPQGFSLRWYAAALASPDIRDALVFSAATAGAVAVIAAAIGIPAAFAIDRGSFPGRASVQGLLMAPMMLPHLVFAVALLQVLATLRVPTSPSGVLIGHVVIAIPFVLRLSLAGLARVDRALERASYSLGASHLRTAVQVTLPLAAPAFAAAAVMAFLVSFDETAISIFVALPGRTTLPALIYEYATETTDPRILAAGSLMILLGFGVAIAAQRFFGLLTLLAGGTRST